MNFGHLTYLDDAPSVAFPSGKKKAWLMRCSCGTEKVIIATGVKYGRVKSCGCLRSRLRTGTNTKHGMTKTTEYYAWQAMRRRCMDPKVINFKDYGGRGVTVAAEWANDFAAFFAHVGKRPGRGYSLDRIDNERGYEPGNVRWATRAEQNANRRNTRWVELNGVKVPLRRYCLAMGIPYLRVLNRIGKLGWDLDRALAERGDQRFRHVQA